MTTSIKAWSKKFSLRDRVAGGGRTGVKPCLIFCIAVGCLTLGPPASAGDWTIDLARGTCGPVHLRQSKTEAARQLKGLGGQVENRLPDKDYGEVEASTRDDRGHIRLTVGGSKWPTPGVYTISISGNFPGKTTEGLSTHSRPGEVLAKLGRPTDDHQDRNFGARIIHYRTPQRDCTFVWSDSAPNEASISIYPVGFRHRRDD